jgi:hypothetical protein
MNNKNNITEHQSVNELRRRIKECKSTLLSLLDDWHYLQNVVQARLMFIYEAFFGDLESDLQNKTRIAAEIERRIELLYYKINKGEQITQKTIDFVNNMVNKEFERYRTDNIRNNESKDSKTTVHLNKDEEINNIINDLDISYIYRQIVKKLHPDVNGYTDEFKKYWDNVQDAYRNSNIHRLKMFFKTLCVDEDGFINDNFNEELKLRNEVRELELNIEIEQRKINRLKRQEPFVFEDKLNDINWIEHRQKLLKDKIDFLEKQIKQNESLLLSLTARPDSNRDIFKFDRKNQFQQDFFSTAYSH